MFPAPPPPAPVVQRGTPFLHCAAGASVWYASVITIHVVIGLKTGSGLDRLWVPLLTEAIVWSSTTIIIWLLLKKVRIKPWILIFVTLPIFIAMWLLFLFVGLLVGVFVMMAG